MEWILWGILLLAQNAAFTWVSRARNSSSVAYHAIASVFSNGVWIASQFVIFDKFAEVVKAGDRGLLVLTCGFYTVVTVIGSIAAHFLLMRFVERGRRKVGG